MAYTEQYNKFEAGFLKEAADQGMDVKYLQGMIAEATEIQEKWAAAFDELEEVTGDKLIKHKIANDLAQWALMKNAEGESWYDPANPQMQKMLGMFGGGGQGGAIGGGIGGGLLGLILGLMTKNPMLGLMLGGLGGAGFGGLLGSGKFKEWFGQNAAANPAVAGGDPNAALTGQEANGGPASDPAQAPGNHFDGEKELLNDQQYAAQQGQPSGEHHDPEMAALQQQRGMDNAQPERFDSELAAGGQQPSAREQQLAEQMQQGGGTNDFDSELAPNQQMQDEEQFAQSIQDQEQMEAGHRYMDANKHYRNALQTEQLRLGQEQDNMPLNKIQRGMTNIGQGAKAIGADVAGAPGRALGAVNDGLDRGIDKAMGMGAAGVDYIGNKLQGAHQQINQAGGSMQQGIDNMISGQQGQPRPLPPKPTPPPGFQHPGQTPMFPRGNVPFSGAPNPQVPKFNNVPTPATATPNVKMPNVSATQPHPGMMKGGAAKLELGGIFKKAHFKLALSSMMSGPSYSGAGSMGGQMQSSVLNMGQPTTQQQAPFLPKGAPIVYPNSSQPRQVNANYAVAPKV